MTGMPRPRPPHLQRERTRHGRAVWYVRVGKGPRVRVLAEYGTPEFDAAYNAAVIGRPISAPGKASAGSIQWLIDRYRESAAWTGPHLSQATRRQRDNIFHSVTKTNGRDAYSGISASSLTKSRDKRAHTPHQARHFLDAMRGLFRWALAADLVKDDPTTAIDNPKRRKGKGFPIWSEDEVDRYQEQWPLGTRQRVWIDVLLYTGLRRGDAVRLGRQHIRNGVATLTTEKSRGEITVTIPLLPVLQRTLEAGPCGDLAFICGERGTPLTKESFGNMFKDACRQAGIVGKSAHGIRKVGATRAAEAGATAWELDALFGWKGQRTSAIYTEDANRKRLGLQAAGKLIRNDAGTSPPAPLEIVRAAGEKSQA